MFLLQSLLPEWHSISCPPSEYLCWSGGVTGAVAGWLWCPPPADSQPPEDRQGKLNGPTDGDYCEGRVRGRAWQQRRKTWGVVRVSTCLWRLHLFLCVCRHVLCVCVCTCAFVSEGTVLGGGRQRCGAWRFNTRCLKSVGLTACHKTAWLIESPGMSSPAVLMNPKPKGLMKRAPFAKTVPRLDLPWPAPLPRHLRVGLHGDQPKESTGPRLSKGDNGGS